MRHLVPCLVAVAFAAAHAAAAPAARVRVSVARPAVAGEVSDRFVSFAVDVDQLVGGTFWDPGGGPDEVRVPPYDFSRPRLRNLTRALAPAYLRLGGSASDVTYYDLDDPPAAVAPPPYQEVLTRAQWEGAAGFARDLGLEIIFTVNAGPGPRDAAAIWSGANVRPLLEHAARRGDPVSVLEWGNEPNLFAVRAGLSGYTPDDYARDFTAFRALAREVLPAARVAGPGNVYTRTLDDAIIADIAFGPRMRALLPAVGPSFDIVTYHYYAAISTRCPNVEPKVTPETALDGAYVDGISEPGAAVGALRDRYAPGAPIWMMESGGQSCGGQSGVGDRFVNSFWYLASLGLVARAGEEVFVRQTLSGSTYGLIDDVTLAPRPDYWAALLWRRLMGRRALAVELDRQAARDVRVFAHCGRGGRPGAVALLALNTSRERPVRLAIRGRGGGPAEVFAVTADDASAQQVRLNGRALEVAPDGTPPPLRPRRTRGAVRLGPLSYAFVVLPRARAPACRP